MKRILLSALILLAPVIALAASETVNITTPTQNTDGTTIPATGAGSITSWRVEYGTCTGGSPVLFGTKLGQAIFQMPALSGTVPGLTAGTQYCFRAAFTNTFSQEGPMSNVAQATTPATTPGAGTINSVTLASTGTTAFSRLPQRDAQTVLAVGSVPLGTPCIADEAIIAHGVVYNAVPAASVTWLGTVQPTIVYAPCG